MADTIDSQVLINGSRRYVVKRTNVSDGTGETNAIVVTKANLTGPLGRAPAKLVIEEITWSIQGFSSVRLFWDHTTADEIAMLGAGNGYLNIDNVSGATDPASAGGTGNIILTTAGAVSGATYSIVFVVRLKR